MIYTQSVHTIIQSSYYSLLRRLSRRGCSWLWSRFIQKPRRHPPRSISPLSHIRAHQLAPLILALLQPLNLLVSIRIAVRQARRRIFVLGGISRDGAEFVGVLGFWRMLEGR